MKRENVMTWDTYFMSLAYMASFRSKDPKTQNGACIVNDLKQILSLGYNGAPRGLDDNLPEIWSDNDEDPMFSKHSYAVHAEMNAIFNSNQADIRGSTLYVTCFPCRDCAKGILQTGIKRVVYSWEKDHHARINETVNHMFRLGDVEIENYWGLAAKDSIFLEQLIELHKGLY